MNQVDASNALCVDDVLQTALCSRHDQTHLKPPAAACDVAALLEMRPQNADYVLRV
jgi:hypothetical protein